MKGASREYSIEWLLEDKGERAEVNGIEKFGQ